MSEQALSFEQTVCLSVTYNIVSLHHVLFVLFWRKTNEYMKPTWRRYHCVSHDDPLSVHLPHKHHTVSFSPHQRAPTNKWALSQRITKYDLSQYKHKPNKHIFDYPIQQFMKCKDSWSLCAPKWVAAQHISSGFPTPFALLVTLKVLGKVLHTTWH